MFVHERDPVLVSSSDVLLLCRMALKEREEIRSFASRRFSVLRVQSPHQHKRFKVVAVRLLFMRNELKEKLAKLAFAIADWLPSWSLELCGHCFEGDIALVATLLMCPIDKVPVSEESAASKWCAKLPFYDLVTTRLESGSWKILQLSLLVL